jgi:hypothetical protein
MNWTIAIEVSKKLRIETSGVFALIKQDSGYAC